MMPPWVRFKVGNVTAGLSDRQLASRFRRLPDRIQKAMQVDGGIERRQPALRLPRADRFGEEAIHLPDVEWVAAREIGRHPVEASGYRHVAQLVAALCALYPKH